ncbi:MAG TPA: anti-sigma factor [Acetobacteraceae bacterium]|nr:anti-sigma factor [Acetobacteraceae bacterium]
MSDNPDGPDDPDLRAAEYVLGVLTGPEQAIGRNRITFDPGFRSAVEAWENRLAPLARLADPVPPPSELWDRITATLDQPPAPEPALDEAPPPPAPAFWKSTRFWKMTTAGALAIAACLAAFIVLRAPPPPVAAVLTQTTGAAPALLALTSPGGTLTIQPATPLAPPPEGRDYELWALPAGALHPHSLGVLPPTGRRLDVRLAPGTRVLVSLEPKGGSPSGLPTGPVLFGGQMERYLE